MNGNIVIYAGNFCIPDGNAAGKRVFANASALKKYGYDVVCFGFHFGEEKRVDRTIEGIRSISLKYSAGISRLFNKRYFEEFKQILEESGGKNAVCAVILYSAMGTMRFNVEIIKYCKKRNIKTVYDFTDFYDKPDRYNLLKYVLKKTENRILKRNVLKQAEGVIAISSFGRTYCQNLNTIIVPPLSLKNANRDLEILPEEITFSFASVINEKSRPLSEWKDRVDTIIDAFYQVHKYGNDNFRIQFIGFDEEHFLRMLEPHLRNEYRGKIAALKNHLLFLGVMNNTDAQRIVQNSHYTIVIRKRMICTNIGFPTKVSESIALGVPVICNITSDIAYYLEEGKTGFLIDDPENIDKIADKLNRIIRIPREDYIRMARLLQGYNPFYYELYQDRLGGFIKKL